MKRRTKIILSICLTLLLVIGAGGYAYVSDYCHAGETALAAMAYQATDQVQIRQNRDVTWFAPEKPAAGLAFYPGGKVEHTAYAPLLRACAERGILCALGLAAWRCSMSTARTASGSCSRMWSAGT